MRRITALLFVLGTSSWAQAPYERLAATAKLWAYIKYIHPRVTAPGVDWDAAFEAAAPKVLASKNDEEFSEAVTEMLARLDDPATRIMPPRTVFVGDETRVAFSVNADDGVTVVRLEKGNPSQMRQNRDGLPSRLKGSTAVVFDLRGSKAMASYMIPPTLTVTKPCAGPSMATREHSGYMAPGSMGSGGYKSSWKMQNSGQLFVGSSGIRAVFLVDRETWFPEVALAMQNCGAGAIVSEDPVEETQADLTRPFKVLGNMTAMVRYEEAVYPDGVGISLNAVLPERGGSALKAAVEMARSGKWPQPQARKKYDLPPAWFTENSYAEQSYPPIERRMLAAARVWSVFHYFHPYRHLYTEDWDEVLKDMLQKMARAENARQYHLAVAEMVAHVHDTHCYVNSKELAAYQGPAGPPIELRWIENQPVVTRIGAKVTDISPGDVLVRIDGEPYQKRADELSKYISASTPQSMKARLMAGLLRGQDGSAIKVTLRNAAGVEREMEFTRAVSNAQHFRPYRGGEPFRLIDSKIGYVDLELITTSQVNAMFEKFKDTEAIIMDMRGYPQGTAWSIAPRLTDKPGKVAAQFRRSLVSPDGAGGGESFNIYFDQRIPVFNVPRYTGKTVMLIDDRAISQSEHSGLFYKTANGTVFIGSPTTGANGDVTSFQAPGGINISFSGHDVRWRRYR